jgi:hypothetical protein
VAAVVPVRHEGHLRSDQLADALRERIVRGEAHRDPGDCLGRAHRGEHQLIGARAEDDEGGLVTRAGVARQLPDGVRSPRIHRDGRGDHVAPRVEHHDHVGANAPGVVAGGREDGERVAARHRLPEAEIRRGRRHAVGQLAGPEAHELQRERAARAELLPGPLLDRSPGAGQHCGQRHSLSDDDQADDQHEKSFAETAH